MDGLDERPGVHDLVVADDGRVTFDVDGAQLDPALVHWPVSG